MTTAKHIFSCIVLFIGILLLRPTLAQPAAFPARREAGLPFIQNFSPKEYGGYHSSNWAILQDQQGIMYFGNSSGVLEYDGVSWRLIPVPNETPVRSLAMDDKGRIYLGAVGEFGYLAPDEWGQLQFVSLLAHVPPENRDFADVWETWITSNGVYFGSNKYLLCWNSIRSTREESANPEGRQQSQLRIWQPKTKIIETFSVHDTVYVQQQGFGLMKLAGDSLRRIAGSDVFLNKRLTFMLAYPEEDNGNSQSILLGTLRHGLYLYDGLSFRPFKIDPSTSRFLADNQIWHGAILADKTFVLASRGKGIAIIDRQGKLLQILNKAAGLQDEAVWYIYPDRSGGLWLALNSGLARVETPSPYTQYTDKQGLEGTVFSIVRHRGRIYAATLKGVYLLSPSPTAERLPIFKTVKGIITGSATLLPVDDILLAGVDNGIFRIEGDQAFFLVELLPYSMHQARYRRDLVFIGHRDGFSVLKKTAGVWRSADIVGISGYIGSIFEESPGIFWLGTRAQGYLRVKISGLIDTSTANLTIGALGDGVDISAEVQVFGPSQGVPIAGWADVRRVNGQPVFYSRKGIRRFDAAAQTFVPDSTFGAIFADTSRYISRMVQLREGAVWIESSKNKLPKRGIATLQESGQYSWHDTSFLRFADFDRFRAIYADPAYPGVIWLGGSDGIVRYNPADKKDFAVDFPALVRRVMALKQDSLVYGGAARGIHESPLLPYTHNALRFQYAAPSYDDPAQNRYRLFLEGFDENWSNWTAETHKDYTNLPEGDYIFRVQAKNIYDHESKEGIYEFTILPPWYHSWWAYGLYGILFFGIFGLVIYGYNKWRTDQLKRRTKELEAVVAERTVELAEKNIELQELNTLKSRFFANISHEFRTPLTLILGQIGNVLPDLKKERNISRLKMAARNGKQLLQLINQLLDLSKFDARQMTLSAAEQNIVPLLRQLTNSFESLAEQRKITLRFESASEDIPVWFEQEKIEKIMHNLLSNALKFTREGGNVQVTVSSGQWAVGSGSSSQDEDTVTATSASGEVKITVRDSGIGIPKDRLPHIFDRFFQVDSSTTREYEGTGIGLALTRELVQLHGGSISAESSEGFGTTFTIRLPLGRAHLKAEQIADFTGADVRAKHPLQDIEKHIEEFAGDASPLTPQPVTTNDTKPQRGKQMTGEAQMTPRPSGANDNEVILIVEDNPDMRAYIRETLVKNYRIIEAPDGEAGFQKAQEEIPDLIITDVMMPRVDGYELTGKLREEQATNHIPIIMLTAKAAESDKFEGLETGVDAFLIKPFSTKELQIRVRKLIELRQKLLAQIRQTPIIKASEVLVSPVEQQFLENLQEIVETNMENETFQVDELCREVGMSQRQLYRKLHALLDCTPAFYIRRIRLERARQLLEQNAGNVTEIAFQVGYGNVSAFARAFREAFQKSPSEFLK